jgi:hypothetical protein
MRIRRVTAITVLAGLLSLAATAVAHAADDPVVLTTPGAPVVVADEPHQLSLTWTPATWIGEPRDVPITHEVRAWVGANVYRSLGTTTGTSITLTNLSPGSEYRLTIWASTEGGYSLDSAATVLRTAYGKAKVSYLNLDWSPTDNQIQHALQVVNTGTEPLDLNYVRVRYHLTFEGGNTSLVSNCDWAAIGCARVRQTIQYFLPPAPPPAPTPTRSTSPSPTPTVYPPPGTPAPGWLELTFAGGVLAPGASTGPIYLRYHRPSWTAIDERDDRSWRQATGAWVDNSRITLDVDGVREFGDTNA